jgi:hypothetical protein
VIAAFLRWCRYQRHLRAEVSRRQWLGYDVGPALHRDLREQARERAGYLPQLPSTTHVGAFPPP